MKYKQLLDIEERYNKQKSSYDSCLHENEQLKQKIDSLANELLTMKSTQSHHQDFQINFERLQAEVQLGVSPYLQKKEQFLSWCKPGQVDPLSFFLIL